MNSSSRVLLLDVTADRKPQIKNKMEPVLFKGGATKNTAHKKVVRLLLRFLLLTETGETALLLPPSGCNVISENGLRFALPIMPLSVCSYVVSVLCSRMHLIIDGERCTAVATKMTPILRQIRPSVFIFDRKKALRYNNAARKTAADALILRWITLK